MNAAADRLSPAAVESVADRSRAAALMHPVRPRILSLAASPASATEIAAELGLSRQGVNYHVRALARAGFLRKAGQRRKRNLVEQRYVATARAYVLTPDVLGPAAPDWRRIEDRVSAAHLVALAAGMQSDLAAVTSAAAAAGQRVSTLSITTELRFASAAQRAAFGEALHRAVLDVVAAHGVPDERGGDGRPYRLVVGCYPTPTPTPASRDAATTLTKRSTDVRST